jgi:hypothetical protein
MSQVVEKHESEQSDKDHGNDIVTITVNDNPVKIHRGHQTVEAIKDAANVPQGYELLQEIDGRLTPLKDDGAVTLKGGEIFESHVRESTSA